MLRKFYRISLASLCLVFIMIYYIPSYGLDGAVIGKVNSVNKKTKEIIVNTESGKVLKLGDKVYVRIEETPVILKVTFPMLTTLKCKPDKNNKNFSLIAKGQTVYKYEPGIEKTEKEAVNESLYLDSPIVGTWDYEARIYETRDYVSGQLTFRADGTYTNARDKDGKKGAGRKDSGKFKFDIENGILEFVDKAGTDMFYAGPLSLFEKDEKSLSYVFYHNQGYAINYKILHSNTAAFKLNKRQRE